MSIRPARWQPERDFPAIAEAFNLVVEETADGERLAAEHAAQACEAREARRRRNAAQGQFLSLEGEA